MHYILINFSFILNFSIFKIRKKIMLRKGKLEILKKKVFFVVVCLVVYHSVHINCPVAGPAAVTGLSMKANSTNSLTFHWSPPEGDFERYEFFLYRGDDSLQERRRGQPSALQCSFQGLTPGVPYQMVVVTHSGEHSNQSSVWARTGEGGGRIINAAQTCRCVKTENLCPVFSPGCCGISESSQWKQVGCSVGELGSRNG